MKNESTQRGKWAHKPIEVGRFLFGAVHSRFDEVVWMVVDIEDLDDLGLPNVVHQGPTIEGALASTLGAFRS